MLELLKVDRQATYMCGGNTLEGFTGLIPYVTSTVILIIQIAVPVLLIIWGMLDLGKAVIAQKEDEIKKGQATFFKRLIAAILVFFVITIVKLVVSFASSNDGNIANCLNCFIYGDESDTRCVKTGDGSNL